MLKKVFQAKYYDTSRKCRKKSPSPPILISDASAEDLQTLPFRCPLPKDTSSSSDHQSPERCQCTHGPRTYVTIKDESPMFKCVDIQIPERKDKCEECVEELFFNAQARNSDGSGGHCNEEEDKPWEEKKPSSVKSEKAESVTCVRSKKKAAKASSSEKKLKKIHIDECLCSDVKEIKKSPSGIQLVKTEPGTSSSLKIKDSGGACSLDSATGSCDANSRANYYQNKLLSTLQILQNKEETIRVQAESLAVAEGRICSLTDRASELRRELERKTKEIQALSKTLKCYSRVEKADVSITADSSGCTCGLEKENARLKQENEALSREIVELCQRRDELEQTLTKKDNLEKKYKEEIHTKEQQLASLRDELERMSEGSRHNNNTCEALSMQLQQMQILLSDKGEELSKMQQQCAAQQQTISELRQELQKADRICKENCAIRGEVSYLTSQVAEWRAQLADSERRVHVLDAKLREAQACYREKEHSVSQLQAQLEQAHARGAALCGHARRALGGVRHWARRMRDRHAEQEQLLKEKDAHLSSLQRRLEEQSSTQSTSDNRPSCSKCLRPPSCCPDVRERQSQYCASEIASCSSAPTPPRRLLRKKPTCGDRQCPASPWLCDATMQQPESRDGCNEPRFCTRRESNQRDLSPAELFQQVEQLTEAFAERYRRWTRAAPR
ncbi:uncharacterized protein LOC142987134 isoform X2 [Anticarsia gemmatalis]|uniref:uncharacterized protein LOC142987134 isoform X2 n=1 Tax=Anticarsia gemmatalis TaxID=129554 RepID=UPI003F76C2A3